MDQSTPLVRTSLGLCSLECHQCWDGRMVGRVWWCSLDWIQAPVRVSSLRTFANSDSLCLWFVGRSTERSNGRSDPRTRLSSQIGSQPDGCPGLSILLTALFSLRDYRWRSKEWTWYLHRKQPVGAGRQGASEGGGLGGAPEELEATRHGRVVRRRLCAGKRTPYS